MQHLPDDALAALALGEPVDGAEHAASCAECAAEIASLRATATRARAAHVPAMAPPAGLWERILDDIAEESAAPGRADEPVAPEQAADATPASRPDVAPRAEADAPSGAPVASLDVARRRRRRFSAGALVAACAASAAVAASLAVFVVAQVDRGPRPTEVAAAVLDPLSPSVSTARAEVIERDGQRLLVVDADALPQTDGYLDVWLLDAQAQQMVSLGVMDRASTQLALPADLDLAAFPIVDVSIEPYDGDPTHSGDSIWRGALDG